MTLHHIPDLNSARLADRSTSQIGEASLMARQRARCVLPDVRPADLAAGGQATTPVKAGPPRPTPPAHDTP